MLSLLVCWNCISQLGSVCQFVELAFLSWHSVCQFVASVTPTKVLQLTSGHLHKTVFGRFWTFSDVFGRFGTFLYVFERFCAFSNVFERFWTFSCVLLRFITYVFLRFWTFLYVLERFYAFLDVFVCFRTFIWWTYFLGSEFLQSVRKREKTSKNVDKRFNVFCGFRTFLCVFIRFWTFLCVFSRFKTFWDVDFEEVF